MSSLRRAAAAKGATSKSLIRKKALKLRETQGNHRPELIIERAKVLLEYLILKDKHSLVGAYYPREHEVSTVPIIDWLHKLAVACALPKITSYERKEMIFVPYSHALTRNKFGVHEPEQSTEVEPTVIIVPIVSADVHGNRLGHGHGYYDRYISARRTAEKSLITIGLCYECCMHHGTLPIELHDQALDYVVTETKIHKQCRLT